MYVAQYESYSPAYIPKALSVSLPPPSTSNSQGSFRKPGPFAGAMTGIITDYGAAVLICCLRILACLGTLLCNGRNWRRYSDTVGLT